MSGSPRQSVLFIKVADANEVVRQGTARGFVCFVISIATAITAPCRANWWFQWSEVTVKELHVSVVRKTTAAVMKYWNWDAGFIIISIYLIVNYSMLNPIHKSTSDVKSISNTIFELMSAFLRFSILNFLRYWF